jgi:hypothetical protein
MLFNAIFRKTVLLAATAAALMTPGRALAGGPPWLTVPIDGVTGENARACSELLGSKLASNQMARGQDSDGVKAYQRDGQWYMAFYFGEDVRLSEIEAALKGSSFSVPRDRIHMFGHVIVELDAKDSSAKALLADLESLRHTLVIESKSDGARLLATIAMPYPTHGDRNYSDDAGWGKFKGYMEEGDVIGTRGDDDEATAAELPSLQTFDKVAAKHKATVKDVRWSVNFACRSVGCVALPKSDAPQDAVAATSPSPSTK